MHYFNAGLEQLKKDIENLSNSGKASINTLCKRDDDNKVCFIALKAAAPLDTITDKYDIMSRMYPTALFNRRWSSHMTSAAKSKSKLTIQSIRTDIWDPCFQECQTLLHSLRDRTIFLSKVDHYFKGVEDMKKQLRILHTGFRRCAPDQNSTEDIPRINSAIDCIEKYWSLCRLAKAAEVVIDLKEKLSLTGDFSLIETLAMQVSYVHT